ncbi:hypothetical protein GOV08_04655 [Candidatus Woesearchaeota archaeon]|nr:hypothetical protein [Candidatus Woesearchaeota archaeon]
MGIFSWAEEKIQSLSVWDFGVVKTMLILLGMIIGAYVSSFVKSYVWYIAGIIILSYIHILYKMFK